MTVNIQVLEQGFGSYLKNILPDDVATAAGAFSVAMRQIKNIESVPIEKLAQVVTNIETTAGLNSVGGTDVPTDTTLSAQGKTAVSLGSGPVGSYTMSDFFGAMSCLPYPLKAIDSSIRDLQTSTLTNIYKQLYLAVTWERATATVQYTDDGFGTYTTTGVTLTDPGGGYGREGAVAPVVTVNGATVTATIGTDDTNLTTFGRVTALNFTPGTTGSVPTISIAYPPGGSSFSNSIVQGYIDDANDEITAIKTANPQATAKLNTFWNITGTQLTIEQRARNTGISPVPSPRDDRLSMYPVTLMSFVDSISNMAQNTKPHMYAQTIEAISDLNTAGGQSAVALARQERNQARLNEIGIRLDNNMPGELNPVQSRILLAVGSLPDAISGSGINISGLTQTNFNGTSSVPLTDDFTVPAILENSGIPSGYLDDTFDFVEVEMFPTEELNLNNMPWTEGELSGEVYTPEGYVPNGAGTLVDTGGPAVPGSLGGSQYTNLIPPSLNTRLTSGVLIPSQYSVAEAIDMVIECNCDCWVQ